MKFLRYLILVLILALSLPAATLVSKATGNFTAAGTWGVGEAGASAIQTTKTSNTNTTTSYVYSSAFTCTNLDVVDGILVYGRRLGTTGTVSVALSDDNGTTATRELAINASDMDDDNSLHFFLFASTLTCDGGTDYKVGVKSSTNAQATFYRDGTAGNWFRVPRTTATAAPGAADILFVTGDLTGAGTGNSFTVTMDNTAATVFGAVTAPQSLGIGVRGTMAWGVVAATAYRLDMAGLIEVWGGGTYNQGTSGARPPTDSSVKLNWDLVANVDSGFICENGGTCNVNGALKAIIQTLLNTDESAGATVIGVVSTSGWAVSDVICFAPTTRTASQAECGTILTVDSGVQFTLTAGLTNAHSGTSPTQAEVINITSNAVIQGESNTLQGFVRCEDTAVCSFDRVEFYRLGSNTAYKRGIDVLTTTGSFSMTNSACHDLVVSGSTCFMVQEGSGAGVVTFSGNVNYAANIFIRVDDITTALSITNNVSVRTVNTGIAGYHIITATAFTFTGNTAAGTAYVGMYTAGNLRLAWSNITIHSNASEGYQVGGGLLALSTITNLNIWRNNGANGGLYFASNDFDSLTITTGSLFGNLNYNAQQTSLSTGILTFNNVTFAGDTTFATGRGYSGGIGNGRVYFNNCTFGVVSGIFVAHTTSDFGVNVNATLQVVLNNTIFASATEIEGGTIGLRSAFVGAQNWDQVAGAHRRYSQNGNVQIDSTTVRASLPSQRVTSNSAAAKLESGPWRVPVASGATVAASAWVRKSTAADSCGAEYNGAELRLILRANSAAGISADTTLDTSTVANGNWEQLALTTGAVTANATLELFVDGDGTTGCFYVESGPYWFDGLPNPSGIGGGAPVSTSGGSSSFVARSFGGDMKLGEKYGH